MNETFDALCRKAATGELTPAEREAMERFLIDHPDRRADLDWDRAFSAKLEAKIAEMPPMPGWERTQIALQAHARTESPAAAQQSRLPANRPPGILDRFSDALASVLGFGLNTQALAIGLIVAQVGVIGLLLSQAPEVTYSDTRSATADATPRGPLLRVSFRPDLREADMRRALSEIGGEIVGGPGQLGIYLIRVRDLGLQAAAERLRQSGVAELVELVAPGK